MQQKKKKVICFMGKSASGKSSIINLIKNTMNGTFYEVKSFSTRQKRINDNNDVNTHIFTDEYKLDYDKAHNKIISIYHSPKGYYNWTTEESFANTLINLYAIDPKSFLKFKKEYSDKFDILGIYVYTYEEVRKFRLKERGEKYEKEEHLSIESLIAHENESEYFDIIFNNGSIEQATFLAFNKILQFLWGKRIV